MSVRRCKRCERTLPLEAFNRYKDGRQWWCRECFKTYFRERGQKHLDQVEKSRTARRERAHRYVLAELERNPCIDCGESDPIVLEFDHLDVKTMEVGRLVGRSTRVDVIGQEIARCEVVCCNCHRRRTYKRRGVTRTPASAQRIADWKIRRNLAWVYDHLAHGRCADCGNTDPLVLEFDHLADKRRNVTQMAWTGYGLETIRLEVAKCVLRCANCHRRKTSADRNTFRHRDAARDAAAAKLAGDGPLA